MNNWIPKNNIMRFAIIMALFSVILYFSGLFFVTDKIKKIEDDYRGAESVSYKMDKIRIIKSTTETNKEILQPLQDFFIQKGDEVKFIERIENIARTSSVKFKIISIDIKKTGKKTSKPDSFKENIDLKVRLEGSWQKVVSFMDKLEKMPFGVSIENIRLDTNASSGWSGLVEFIIFREK